jgi:uncharacterized protein YjlB
VLEPNRWVPNNPHLPILWYRKAIVILRGPNGRELSVQTRDVVVLPAGTGHAKLSASTDFLVVGALSARSALGSFS